MLSESALRRAVLIMRDLGLLYREMAPHVGLSPVECQRICADSLLYRRKPLFSTVTRIYSHGAAVLVNVT